MNKKSAGLMPVAKGELRNYGTHFYNVRPGSMKILKSPSRYGNRLVNPVWDTGREK